jgi:hypothetical protein
LEDAGRSLEIHLDDISFLGDFLSLGQTDRSCPCTPDCGDRECGPDPICDWPCGECETNERCITSGVCECDPDCGDRECGMDPVCGTLDCGSCSAHHECNEATGECECVPDCGDRECGMDPVCGTLDCGSCSAHHECNEATGECECIPDCGESECGMDPACGTLDCGSCSAHYECNPSGICDCVPDCGDRECGVDPICSTSCGSCDESERCNADIGICGIPPCDGGLLDLSSGLCWQNPPLEGLHRWPSAVDYCRELDLGGHGPGSWHLPTISELRSFIRGCPETMTGGECSVDDSCTNIECDDEACRGCDYFEGPGTEGAYWPGGVWGSLDGSEAQFWSSSTDEGSSIVWTIIYSFAHIHPETIDSIRAVRCVRGEP